MNGTSERNVTSSYWALRLAFGIVPIVAGADKFANLLVHWEGYLSPIAVRVLPFSPTTFMHLAGIVEVVVGAAVLLGRARIFGFVASAWLACIALQLLTTGHFFDIAARDAVMAVAAFALGRLAQRVEQPLETRAVVPADAQGAHA